MEQHDAVTISLMSTTAKEQEARKSFDLDAAMASLPAAAHGPPSVSHRGSAGFRLRHRTPPTISDDLLREFACQTLGALRCSAQYLDALRQVIANQADADASGYLLEMNVRVPFTTERTMRTILQQMSAAGITFGRVVPLGDGHSQVVQCFRPDEREPGEALLHFYRRDDARASAATPQGPCRCACGAIDGGLIPY